LRTSLAILISLSSFLICYHKTRVWKKTIMRNMQFRLLGFWALVVGMFLAAAPFSWAQAQSRAVVVKATKHALAPPLSQIVPIPPRSARPILLPDDDTLPIHGPRITSSVKDSVLQGSSDITLNSAVSTLAATSGLNLLGVGTGFLGFSIQAAVAVPNGAAGPTQFVQIVNDSFAVFNKSTGSVEYGPADGNTLWQALGAPCSSNPNMDESAQFDKLAQVWVILMPVYSGPNYLCIAVSTTSNATNGGWNLYAFEAPTTPLCGGCRPMSDYPKLGVWPDGYYITYNQGDNNNFLGAAACVVNRAAMLTGAAATMQCFNDTAGSVYGSLLPGDVDGTTPPPVGTPENFLSFDYNDESLDLWQFHVNWTTPTSSTYTGPTNIPVAAFLEPCGDTVTVMTPSDNCVPQAGTTEMLGAFGDRLMYRLAYRNFRGYQSLVANHTVETGTNGDQTGIRWYELRNTGAGFKQYQEGTYAPDTSYRFMGSIAMDKLGDMGLGYNVSSSALSPSIRYTGRLATDPLGQMESEFDVLSAASVAHTSQTNTPRWGDFSSMAIDPTDDCTFWYTNEYQTTTGSNHWSTRIASFSFPSCTAPTPWAIVNKASNAGNPVTNLTTPATGAGHLIAVAMIFNGSTSVASVSDNATGGSNTYVSAGAKAAVDGFSTEIWYAVNSKSGATVVTPKFAGSPSHVEITVWEVSGISTFPPDAANSSSGSVTLDNTHGPAVTTTEVGDFILSVLFAGEASFTAISSGNDFTDDFTTDGNGWAHLTSNTSPASTYQAGWFTAAPAGQYCASTVAFRPN
jgi:hypothetical protein